MTEDELDAEHTRLVAEHVALEAEHERLHERPKDIGAHTAHATRLRAHTKQLHDYILRIRARRLTP